MEFLEKDLEDVIFYADKPELQNRGLYISGKLLRQVRIGNYGICDLLEFQRPQFNPYTNSMEKGLITIFELKQKQINVGTFLQALGYLKGVKNFLSKKGIENNYNYSIVLIGKNIDTNSNFVYLSDFLNYDNTDNFFNDSSLKLSLFTYNYFIDGMQFKEISGYKLINEGF
jgi:hypothetical protein